MRQWTGTIGQLGLIPVYPPREDVQVGDIYVFSYDPSGDLLHKLRSRDLSDMLPSRWDAVDLRSEIASLYAERHMWPPTPERFLVSGDETVRFLLRTQDIEDASALAGRLRQPASDDALSLYLQQQLSPTTRTLLGIGEEEAETPEAGEGELMDAAATADAPDASEPVSAEPPSAAALEALVSDLNEVLQRQELWDEDRFRGVTVSPSTRQLAQTRPRGAMLVRLNRLLLQDAYSDHLHLPLLGNAPQAPPIVSASGLFDIPSVRYRLPLVGFPEFTTTSFSGVAADAVIPAEAASVGLGVVGAGQRTVSVKVASGEQFSVPSAKVLDRLIKLDETGTTAHLRTPYEERFKLLLRGRQKGNSKRVVSVWMQVLTDVYYTRALDISVDAGRAMGARAQANFTAPLGAAEGGATTTATTSSAAVSSAVTAPDSLNLADRLNQELNANGSQSVPGGSVAFLSASSSAVSMRRTWHYPLALGYRGWSLKVELRDGVIKVIDIQPTKIDHISAFTDQA